MLPKLIKANYITFFKMNELFFPIYYEVKGKMRYNKLSSARFRQ